MIQRPSNATLKRYGLTEEYWLYLLGIQSYKCSVCQRGTMQSVTRMVIDHEHVKGWKKMKPAERANYVRGLLCNRCNWQFIRRGMTARIATNLAAYLTSYENRKNGT